MFQSRAGSGLTGGGFCNIQGGMSLSLRPSELLSRARTDLRIGVPVVLRDGDRAALVLAAEVARADRLDGSPRRCSATAGAMLTKSPCGTGALVGCCAFKAYVLPS